MRNPNPILIVSVVKDGASKVAILIFTDLIFYLKPLDTSLLVAFHPFYNPYLIFPI